MKKLLFILIFIIFNVNIYADGEKMLDSSNALQTIIQSKNIPKALVDKTVAIAVFPDVSQAGFIVGGIMGSGIMVKKDGSSWSAPLHVKIAGGSLGVQIGYQKSDMVFFILSADVVNSIFTNKTTIGVDATATFWDKGGTYVDMTDFKFTSDIYVFASNKGLFAGVSLGGTVLSKDDEDISSTEYATQRWQGVLDMLSK